MRFYEYRHIVGFEETNLVGNVYYVAHLSWQGRCRELFLREKTPDILQDIASGYSLITSRCSCEYLSELSAFDEVIVRMTLGSITLNRLQLRFEYWRQKPGGGEELVGRGEQQVVCMRREGKQLVPAAFPEPLRRALEPYESAVEIPVDERRPEP